MRRATGAPSRCSTCLIGIRYSQWRVWPAFISTRRRVDPRRTLLHHQAHVRAGIVAVVVQGRREPTVQRVHCRFNDNNVLTLRYALCMAGQSLLIVDAEISSMRRCRVCRANAWVKAAQ